MQPCRDQLIDPCRFGARDCVRQGESRRNHPDESWEPCERHEKQRFRQNQIQPAQFAADPKSDTEDDNPFFCPRNIVTG
jgi:hypothetical protein